MQKYRKLEIELLDTQLTNFTPLSQPKRGWINKIRKALCITLKQLSNKIGVSPEAVLGYEKSEINDNITLKTLKKTAEAMNCQLHYCFIPNNKLISNLIKNQALKKATKIVNDVNSSMILEDQAVTDKEKSIISLANDLINNLNSKLWNDD